MYRSAGAVSSENSDPIKHTAEPITREWLDVHQRHRQLPD